MKKFLSFFASALLLGSMTITLTACVHADADEGYDTPKFENQTITVNGVSFKMIAVEGGTFQMGTPESDTDAFDEEKPQHEVTLSSYYIGETEVTQELWEAVTGSNHSDVKGAKLPIGQVSWEDCQAFISKLNQMTGKTFRLPTEAQWEYAARGGKKSKGYIYSGSGTIDEVAWYEGGATHDVATKKANELGIYDMSGNAWEWCQDWYGSYTSDAQTNPQGPASGSKHIYRGGSTFGGDDFCRVVFRNWAEPSYSSPRLGFRLAM